MSDYVLDRLREMFGIVATEPDAVFDALERYDAHNLRLIERLQAQVDALTADEAAQAQP